MSTETQAFSNVGLSTNTVADWMCDLVSDLQAQLMEKGKDFIEYSVAVDESTDTTDTAQLAIFICSLCVIEERLGFKSLHTTTRAKGIFNEVSKCVIDMKLLGTNLCD